MITSELDFHLDANGEGEVHLPMGSTMTHLRAVRAVIGPDFKILTDDDYDPARRYEVFRIFRKGTHVPPSPCDDPAEHPNCMCKLRAPVPVESLMPSLALAAQGVSLA